MMKNTEETNTTASNRYYFLLELIGHCTVIVARALLNADETYRLFGYVESIHLGGYCHIPTSGLIRMGRRRYLHAVIREP